MTHNLKPFYIVMAVLFVIGAVTASPALAETNQHRITSSGGTYPVSLDAGQDTTHVFSTAAGREVTCKKATFTGTLSEASTGVEMTPTYEECHTVLAGTTLSATVTMNGCTDTVTTPITHKSTPSGTVTTPGEVHIKCPAGQSITVDLYAGATHKEGDATFCKLHIGPQTRSGVTISNFIGGVIRFIKNIIGIVVTRTGNATCGALSTTATYTGTSTVTGNGGATAIDVG